MVEFCRILKIIIMILTTSYFLAIIWLIQTEFQFTFLEDGFDNFMTVAKHEFYEKVQEVKEGMACIEHTKYCTNLSNMQILVKTCYYALTTLTTIGFGDMSPVSNQEMIVCTVILLIGVAVFSIFLNSLVSAFFHQRDMLAKGYQSDLNKWINMLQRYNGSTPLSKDIISKIEQFFDYYWTNNRLSAFTSESDKRLFDELP